MQEKLDEFESQLSNLVGLDELKLQLRRWAKGMLMNEKRRAMGFDLGTGMTTVARILGKLLSSVCYLSIQSVCSPFLVVLYIYRIRVEGNLVVIFAGYTEPMRCVFASNEGSHFYQFDDFSCKELAEMLLIKTSTQDQRSRLFGFMLASCCGLGAVERVIKRLSTKKVRSIMNGGLVDHMLNNARENLDSRLDLEAEDDELVTITLKDLEAGLKELVKRLKVGDKEKAKKVVV